MPILMVGWAACPQALSNNAEKTSRINNRFDMFASLLSYVRVGSCLLTDLCL
jgi:hypothetical protein